MHHHCEIVIPIGVPVEGSIESVMSPFDENGVDEDGQRSAHAFWDYYVIGGRWAGDKVKQRLDQAKLNEFFAWCQAEHVTVSGLRFGKQELSPASQIAKVDAKWRELFPGAGTACPIFMHSNPDGKPLDGDVMTLEASRSIHCDRVIFAAPSYVAESKTFTGPLRASFILVSSAWNGVNHMKIDWDGTVGSALAAFTATLDHAGEEWRAAALPRDDWQCVTVDYHS